MARWLAVLLLLIPPGSLLAHHALTNFDTTRAVRVTGAVIQFHRINPHSVILLEESGAERERRRWAVEGPAGLQLDRRGIAKDALKPGDVVAICGYLPKETVIWQIANPDPAAVSLSGRLINAEAIVLPDGREQSWGDYGVHKCFAPGFRDQHSK